MRRPPAPRPNTLDDFWPRVNKTDGCWLWTGARGSTGYGVMPINGKRWGAHRLSWLLAFGPIPAGLHVCHRCDTPLCVRPDHLFLGTRFDNMSDAARKGRMPGPGLRGEGVRNSKLTAKQVLEIRARRANGEAQRALARAFGIDKAHVKRIVLGESWAHLPLGGTS